MRQFRIARRRARLAWEESPVLQAVIVGITLFPLAFISLWLLLAVL